jgi:ATP adenylyltransferase
MRYISGGAKEDGCIFCNRLASDHDLGSLILHRGAHTFVMMNLYPYNTGHIMLVPNDHAADPGQLSRETLHEMGESLPMLTSALRRVFDCDGFNVGLNIGSIAGAGVGAHLHQHIVPRWAGDANFMPILASTMVIPETIPVTYAKIRAELDRDISRATEACFVLLDTSGENAFLNNGRIPSLQLKGEVPVWKSIVDAVPESVNNLELVGWAGSESTLTETPEEICLTLRGTVEDGLPEGWALVAIDDTGLDQETADQLLRAHAQLAPVI